LNILRKQLLSVPPPLIRTLKIIPTITALLFVIFSVPYYDVLFIPFILGFLFSFGGDIGIIFNLFVGVGLFLIAHLLFAFAYLNQIRTFIIQPTGTYTFIGLSLVLFLLIIIFLFYYLFKNNPRKEKTSTLYQSIALLYFSVLFLHSMVAFLFAYNYSPKNYGLLTIFFGSVSYLISDIEVMIRELHHKRKHSVLIIMSSYYLALYLISITTYFFP
jgi:uncharacterized membrane protein YhhN